MNQILSCKQKIVFNKPFVFYMSILLLSVTSFIFLFTLIISKHNKDKQEYKKLSSLSYSIKLQSLYNENNSNNSYYPTIGSIVIEKINLNYPIFSYTNDKLLNVGICKVAGPSVNTRGNLCLAGHNLENNDFFSQLKKLKTNDIVKIYDKESNHINYVIYNIFEVNENNIEILLQNTNYKEITLITCNNLNKKRIVIKAKEID